MLSTTTGAGTRRNFIRLLGGAAVLGSLSGCGLVTPRQLIGSARVGWLGAGPSEPRSFEAVAFDEGLRDLGYVEGKNLAVEWRFSHDGPGGQFSDLAAELIRAQVQVIVTSTTPALVAAAHATRGIPIVSGGPSRDLVDLGLAESYARPGGNVTGTGANLQVYAKLVDLLRQTIPSMTRVGYLRNPTTPGTEQQMALAQSTAAHLGLEFLELRASTASEIDAAFGTAASTHIDGLVISADNLFGGGSDSRVVTLSLQNRLPAISSQVQGYVDLGGLMAYSPDFAVSQRRAAVYADKILKGTNPADLPIEQAMTFDFAINLRTAEAMGLTIPDDVLLQATQVIR
jgi:putative ABC transport system substrate-binding protein